MAISGQQTINIGAPNDSANSDSLYTAFNTIQNNFTQLFDSSSPITSIVPGTGISISNSTASSYVITNTGVTTLVAGDNVTITNLGGTLAGNGTLVISSTGTDGNGGGTVTSVGVISDTLSVTNSPIIGSGNIVVDMPVISDVSGTYTGANLTIDEYGRVTSASNGSGSGTVTSVSVTTGTGLSVSGSPITSSGTINLINTGVTSIVAGTGISINQSNGAVTVTNTGGNGGSSGGTVTRVGVLSNSLTVSGSPITTSGNITIELPSQITIDELIVDTITTGNIDVVTPNSATGITLTTSSNDSIIYGMAQRKSRGTSISPSAIQSGDALFNVDSYGYTSFNQYQPGGTIVIFANGTSSTGNSFVPSSVRISSTDDTVRRDMILDNAGNLTLPGRISQRLYSNIAAVNGISQIRARGTSIDNIAILQVGDSIGRQSFYGYTGNGTLTVDNVAGWSYAGTVESVVTDLPSSSGAYIPSSYFIKTISTANSVYSFEFSDSGNLTIPGVTIADTFSANLNVSSNGNISAVGNITSGNADLGNLVTANFFTGVLTTGDQPNITSVGTLTSLDVTGNAVVGGVVTDDYYYANGIAIVFGESAAGSNTQIQFNSDGVFDGSSKLTFDNVSDTLTVTGNVSATDVTASTLGGSLTTSDQPNITSIGTLTSLDVTGNITSGNANLGNLTTSNYFTGVLTTSDQPNITSIGTLTSLDVTGDVTASTFTGSLTTSDQPNITAVGTLTSLDVTGDVTASTFTGVLTTGDQPNITAVGTLTSLDVTGNANIGGLETTISATANTTATVTATIPIIINGVSYQIMLTST